MSRAASQGPWIHSAAFDLTFFVGAPLLCLAVMLPLASVLPSASIYLAVMAFSSFGHHLPGFLRAYGEADVFRAHRTHLILAPILFFAAFLFFAQRELHGMLLFLMAWSVWHVAMQHFGFLRIYDAKVGQTSKSVARLDRALVLSWFATAVFVSPQYSHDFLANLVEVGVGLPPAEWLRALRWGLLAVTGGITLAWIAVCVRLLRSGAPLSWVKIVLHVVTIAFLIFVWAGLGDLLLGLAIWEVFHDLQYFAITWLHGQRLVAKGEGDTRFMRFLFRSRWPLIALYVAAIAGYGALNFFIVTRTTPGDGWHAALMAFVFTSTALHYDYDSFLWKVRQRRTRSGLGIEREAAAAATGTANDGGRWSLSAPGGVASFGLALPLGAFAFSEMTGERAPQDELEARRTIRDVAPQSGAAHRNHAFALGEAGRGDEELSELERAVALEEHDGIAHTALATALLEQFGAARRSEAEGHLKRAAELRPRDPLPLVNLALLRLDEGRVQEAVDLYRAVRARPGGWEPRTASDLTLAGIERLQAGDLGAAQSRLAHALSLSPADLDAWEAVVVLCRARGDLEGEARALSELQQLAPARDDFVLAWIDQRLRAGAVMEAIERLEQRNASHPDDLDRKLMLAELYATHPDDTLRRGPRAKQLAQEVVERTSRAHAGALDVLAAALAECGEFEAASQTANQALELALGAEQTDQARAIRERLDGYAAGRAHRASAAVR